MAPKRKRAESEKLSAITPITDTDIADTMFNTKDKRVQETWKWTEPPKCPSMDRVLRMMVMRKDAGKGKAKARGNNAKGKGKTREGKGKASAGKGKGKK